MPQRDALRGNVAPARMRDIRRHGRAPTRASARLRVRPGDRPPPPANRQVRSSAPFITSNTESVDRDQIPA
ncbi:hypothetical protein C7S16_4482 [Burkholderia thailandensis]|uniref:Uncharacterized protein n=1 Tax=Burkholderia thailandensis TaxID=57975 RepID=A0AAW9CNI4_BURTH|nr:hypothetical protein [Burkholderia thailandensis]MDW9252413.1 hypothetical protein [Burkholderia thailandensis]